MWYVLCIVYYVLCIMYYVYNPQPYSLIYKKHSHTHIHMYITPHLQLHLHSTSSTIHIRDLLEPGCSVLLHNKINSVVGILPDDAGMYYVLFIVYYVLCIKYYVYKPQYYTHI
jgi:hypothetical protein